MTRRVAVTGLGCVSSLGQSMGETWRGVAEGRSGIRTLTRSLEQEPSWTFTGPAGFIETLDVTGVEAHLGPRVLAQLDPASAYAATATLEALNDAGLLGDPVLGERTAVAYGAGSGGNATLDAAYYRLMAKRASGVHPLSIPKAMISAPASQISMLFGIRGPTFVVSSACASSAHALGEAMHMIRSGRVEVAVAGGVEACLTLGSWTAWMSLRAVAGDTCRPFSAGRQGMILGEGAATLVLEDWDRAKARGATIHGELVGYGASADAKDLTAPNVDGVTAAIAAAHRDAGLDPKTPVLISSHGTGTRLNDKTEAEALNRFYGEALADDVVIATKSAHAHLIGGSGALEFALGLLALRDGVAPPVLNWLGPDPECALPLALQPTPLSQEFLVSNSFAFGGLNAVLVGRRA